MFFQKAAHGEGSQGLAEIVEGQSHKRWGFRLQEFGQALGKPGVIEVAFRGFGGLNEVRTFERREGRVLIVGQGQVHAVGLSLQGEYPRDVAYRAFVAVHVGVKGSTAHGRQVGLKIAAGATRPGVVGLHGAGKEILQALQIGIEYCAGQSRAPQDAG